MKISIAAVAFCWHNDACTRHLAVFIPISVRPLACSSFGLFVQASHRIFFSNYQYCPYIGSLDMSHTSAFSILIIQLEAPATIFDCTVMKTLFTSPSTANQTLIALIYIPLKSNLSKIMQSTFPFLKGISSCFACQKTILSLFLFIYSRYWLPI